MSWDMMSNRFWRVKFLEKNGGLLLVEVRDAKTGILVVCVP